VTQLVEWVPSKDKTNPTGDKMAATGDKIISTGDKSTSTGDKIIPRYIKSFFLKKRGSVEPNHT
jgi:hypothetical protein